MTEPSYLIQNFTNIELTELLDRVKEMKSAGCRLGQICATPADGKIELLYSFDDSTALQNLRLIIEENIPVPSITETYWPAFIYENEIHDLFGVEFTDSKLDYKGNFFRLSHPTPWKPVVKEGE